MRQLNVIMLFLCCAAMLFVIACADNTQKEAEQATPETTVALEEVTLTVTGMT